jgi:hypothetical protein
MKIEFNSLLLPPSEAERLGAYVSPVAVSYRVTLEGWIAATPPESLSAGMGRKVAWPDNDEEIIYGNGDGAGANGGDSAGFDAYMGW